MWSFPCPLKCLVHWNDQSSPGPSGSHCRVIPADIILYISDSVVSPTDLLSFSLTSRHIYSVLLPKIYHDVRLGSSEQCITTLGFLLGRPDVASFVRKLVLRPNHRKLSTFNELLEEKWTSEAIERLAVDLPVLHTFIWEGLEMPNDRLWLTLRTSCAMLKTVGSSIGYKALNPDSHLYEFNELLGFSLTLNTRNVVDRNIDSIEEYPERLWKMLLEKCPQLEELSLGGVAPSWSRVFNVRRVTSGRWPSLRRLMLGFVMRQHDFEVMFSPFLAAHPTLQKLAVYHEGIYYSKCLRLPDSALPSLVELAGPSSYLSGLPGRHLVQTLCLTSYRHPAAFLPSVCELLRGLTSLNSLSIWVDLSYSETKPGAHGMFLHSILESCPRLSHFEVICSTKSRFTFGIDELSIAVCDSPQLRTLAVTKRSQRSSDSEMIQSAAKFVRENCCLQRLTVNIADEQWYSGNTPQLKATYTFETIIGENKTATSLAIREWRDRFFGPVSHRYRHEL